MIEHLVANMIGPAFFLVILLVMAKSSARFLFARELENHKIHLKAQADREIDELKNSLKRAAATLEFRGSTLQQKKADVVAELYGHLSEIDRAVQGFTALAGSSNGEAAGQGRYRQAMQKTVDFFWFLDSHRLYLRKELAGQMECLAEALRSATITLSTYLSGEEENASEDLENKLRGALKGVADLLPATRKALENEFQRLLAPPSAPKVSIKATDYYDELD